MRAGVIKGAVRSLRQEVATAASSLGRREDEEEGKERAREEALVAQYQ